VLGGICGLPLGFSQAGFSAARRLVDKNLRVKCIQLLNGVRF
jgi:hypothetical protein